MDSEQQYGRKTHVFHQIKSISSKSNIESKFILSGDGGMFDSEDVITISTQGSFFYRLSTEFWRTGILLKLVIESEDSSVIYTREDPHFAALLVSFLLRIPLIVESNGLPTVPDSEYPLQGKIIQFVRWAKWREAKYIVAVSDELSDYLTDDLGLENVIVIENGVDPDLFTCKQPVSQSPPYDVRYIGGLQEHQNIDKLMRVVSLLNTEVQFTIVGGRDEEHERLRDTAQSEGIDDKINFVERVPHEEVPAYYNEADFCLGGILFEPKGAPIKLYEALASGREIVFAVDNGLDKMKDYPGVHIIPISSSKKMAAEIDDILNRCNTNWQGRRFVIKERSWDVVADEIIDLCQEVADKQDGIRSIVIKIRDYLSSLFGKL